MTIRASELAPEQFEVVGYADDPVDFLGAVPTKLLVNYPGAVEMRFGNTAEELALSDWAEYASETRWWMPSGVPNATVYGQFRYADGSLSDVIAFQPSAGAAHDDSILSELPISAAVTDPYIQSTVWHQDFQIGRDGWSSLDGAGAAYPVSWSESGEYVWTDASRWAPQDFEGESGVVALLTRPAWNNFYADTVNLAGGALSLSVRADGLNLEGGQAFLFIDDGVSQWRSADPVDLGDGSWAEVALSLSTDPGAWVRLSGSGDAIDLAHVSGWGIYLSTPGAEPSGVIAIDNVDILPPVLDAPEMTVPAGDVTATEDDAVITLDPIVIGGPGDQHVQVDIRLSDPALGKIMGIGAEVAGLYQISGTVDAVNLLLQQLNFVPEQDATGDFDISISARYDGIGSHQASDTIHVSIAPVEDDPTVAISAPTVAVDADASIVRFPDIRVDDGDADDLISLTIEQTGGPAGAFASLDGAADGTITLSGTRDEVNRALSSLVFYRGDAGTDSLTFALTIDDGRPGVSFSGGTITVEPLAETATATGIVLPGSPISVLEGSANGTVLADLGGTDAYGADYSFSLLDSDDGRFAIASDGTLTVNDHLLLDYEAATSHVVTVRATDSVGHSIEQQVTINVGDVVGEIFIGDDRSNVAQGGDGADIFYGSNGTDTFIGGAGDDFYAIFSGGVQIVDPVEAGSFDRAATQVSYALPGDAEIEKLYYIAPEQTNAINLTGNDFAQTIEGNAGVNRITGRGGADILTGFGGVDYFVFDTALGAGNVDTITDFTANVDKIVLSSAIFHGLSAEGFPASAFEIGAAATDAQTRILYDSATGALAYDSDGNGATQPIVFASLAPGLSLTASDFVVETHVDPADLSPGQVLITDVSFDPFWDGLPVTVLSNVTDAVEMRVANTRADLATAAWQPYDNQFEWAARTGVGENTVYLEYRLADDSIYSTHAVIPPYSDANGGAEYVARSTSGNQTGAGNGLLWHNTFDQGTEFYSAYDYGAGNRGLGKNIYYPSIWSPSGGINDGGYVTVDDSQWIIDSPETPQSILALMTYARWQGSGHSTTVNFEDSTVEFYLKGDNLDLNGAQAYFWVLDVHGCWKDYTTTLNIGDGDWAFNSIQLGSVVADNWDQSFHAFDGEIDFTQVASWGIGFIGFDPGDEPTGSLSMDEFVVRQTGARLDPTGLDQDLHQQSAADTVIEIDPIYLHATSPTGEVVVTLTLSDPDAGTITGLTAESPGQYVVRGTADEVEAALAGLTFERASGFGGGNVLVLVSVDDEAPASDPFTGVITLDLPESPSAVQVAGGGTLEVNENAADGAVVGALTAANDTDSPLTFSLVDDAGGRFSITADGQLKVLDGLGLDYEQADAYSVTVAVTNGFGAPTTATFTVSILDVNPETVIGDDRANIIAGGDSNDHLLGQGGEDQLNGGGGDDNLDGGTGADVMTGGDGNDFFFVDNAGDQIVELGGGGDDRVFASVTYALAAGAEIEKLTTTDNFGTAAINLTGNELGQSIFGNDGSNTLTGGGGLDSLSGLGGDDRYYVDGDDLIYEAVGGGHDRVFTSASYTLNAGAEVESVTTDDNFGTTAINITGNSFSQAIFGNEGSNILTGGGGADSLSGLGGNDFYYADGDDTVFEAVGGGIDRVFASESHTLRAASEVELLTTDDNSGTDAINLTGNAFDQAIYGNDGANVLDGKGGVDDLIGAGGADTFAFTTALGPTNVDVVYGFESGTDRIALDHDIFTGIDVGALAASAFVTGNAAQDADDRILFDAATGWLSYDADGSGAGAAIHFATLTGNAPIVATDIVVV